MGTQQTERKGGRAQLHFEGGHTGRTDLLLGWKWAMTGQVWGDPSWV